MGRPSFLAIALLAVGLAVGFAVGPVAARPWSPAAAQCAGLGGAALTTLTSADRQAKLAAAAVSQAALVEAGTGAGRPGGPGAVAPRSDARRPGGTGRMAGAKRSGQNGWGKTVGAR